MKFTGKITALKQERKHSGHEIETPLIAHNLAGSDSGTAFVTAQTSYDAASFPEMLMLQTPEDKSVNSFDIGVVQSFYLLQEAYWES